MAIVDITRDQVRSLELSGIELARKASFEERFVQPARLEHPRLRGAMTALGHYGIGVEHRSLWLVRKTQEAGRTRSVGYAAWQLNLANPPEEDGGVLERPISGVTDYEGADGIHGTTLALLPVREGSDAHIDYVTFFSRSVEGRPVGMVQHHFQPHATYEQMVDPSGVSGVVLNAEATIYR